jgi:hypothetical protein
MFQKVKTALRLKSPAFDDEIESLIAAAKADLRLVGIKWQDDEAPVDGEEQKADDPLIERAVILYCKGHFGYIEGGERYIKAYDLLKCSLSLAGDYNALE